MPQAMPPPSESTARDGKVETLTICDAPEALEEDDYPDVPYWHDTDWANYGERLKDRGKPIPKLGFLTDEGSAPVMEPHIKEFMSHAKQAWNELYRHRLNPLSWTKKTPSAASYFVHKMKSKFLEFCYCDGDWKVEQFAIIKYPDWCWDVRVPGKLTCAPSSLVLFSILLMSFHPRCSAF